MRSKISGKIQAAFGGILDIAALLTQNKTRRDEQANLALALQLAQQPQKEAVCQLVRLLDSSEPALQIDAIKVLYELGQRDPQQIAPYYKEFLALLKSKNNRLVWGGMIALGCVAPLDADVLFSASSELVKHLHAGTTITKDHAVLALAGIAQGQPAYARVILPQIFEHLRTCRPSSLAQHAEKTALAVNQEFTAEFVHLLQARLPDLTPAQAHRVQNLIDTFEKPGR